MAPDCPSVPVSSQKRRLTDGKANSTRFAYDDFLFDPIPSTGRPGTPHCYFDESYRVRVVGESEALFGAFSPVIHRHSNGLCIVTAGDVERFEIDSVRVLLEAAADQKQDKTSRKDNVSNIRPTDTLAEIGIKGGDRLLVPSCIMGTVIEINQSVTPMLLSKDPLLDGFLAVIRPAGLFPPKKKRTIETTDPNVADLEKVEGSVA